MKFWPLSWSRDRAAPRPAWDLSTPLLQWSKDTPWTIGDSVMGTLVLGATGSGKSSGSGRCVAESMLSAGFGGLVLTAKRDECAQWQAYARAQNRASDVLVFGSGESRRFNFIDYEATRAGDGAGLTENIVQLLGTVMEVTERGTTGGGGRDSDPYWRQAAKQLMRNVVDLSLLATGRVSVPELYRLVVSAPTNLEFVRSESWRANSACCRAIAEADRRVTDPARRRDLEIVADYFLQEFPSFSDRTRSSIVSMFTSTIDPLNRGLLRTLLCSETNVTPEVVEDGKILILNLPVKEYGFVGQVAQVIVKTAFMRAIERRNVARNPRPVFLFADEAQHFVTSQDALFQTTCRSSRVATVLLTQNLSILEAAMGGGDKGRAEAVALLGNLNTKILHCNSDPYTNEWAADLIGRSRQMFANTSAAYNPTDWASNALGLSPPGQATSGLSEAYEYALQPSAFSLLRTGGPDCGMLVDAVVFQNGRRFAGTDRNYLHATFRQVP